VSLKITAELFCDSCGETLCESHNKSTDAGTAYYRAKRNALSSGWVILQRGGPARHFCPKCAEKVQAKKFTAFTPEELAKRRVSRVRGKHMKVTMKEQKCWSEELFQAEKWKFGL
jgi:predicted RNA-binding Zn-ribbon protein involved in translation (DUF1610 family)